MTSHFSVIFHGDSVASSQTRHRRRLYAGVEPKHGMRILDVGCGTGSAALELAQFEDTHIVGVDSDMTKVAKANQLSVKHGLSHRVKFVHAAPDGATLLNIFGRQSFDGIYCLETLKSAASFNDIYRNLAQLLRMGGRLTVYEWCWTPRLEFTNADHVRFAGLIETSTGIGHRPVAGRTVDAALQALEDAGLSVIFCQDLAHPNPAAVPWYDHLDSVLQGNDSWSGSFWRKDSIEVFGGLTKNSAQLLSEAGRLQVLYFITQKPPPLRISVQDPFQAKQGMPSIEVFSYVLVACVAILLLRGFRAGQRLKYRVIPSVGSQGLIASYITAISFLFNSKKIILEGYEKHRGKVFKIPLVDRWHILVSGASLVDDLKKAPEDVLSFQEGANVTVQTDHTFGTSIRQDPYHISVIQGSLTRNLGDKILDLRKEAVASFGDEIPITEEWTSYPVWDAVMNIVARTSNRVYVGLPLCRNAEYININKYFTVQVVISAQIINLFPSFLKGLVGQYLTPVPGSIKRASQYLQPIIEKRLRRVQEEGSEYSGKPNDLLSWLIDEATNEERRNVQDLVRRVLTVNFASIHSTTMACVNFLYCLAAHPQYVDELREEVESIVEEEGWTKASLQRMRKLDSFLKESERYSGSMGVVLNRMVLKDFTFSDGTTVPTGSMVGVPGYALHHDESYYPDPNQFIPSRFAKLQSHDESKHQLVSLSSDYTLFGVGRHACPGRFFAASELKIIIAHALLTYDLRFANEGVIPDSMWFGIYSTPNRNGKILFRKRAGN
ncbi:cytochrome p450 [Moniliophthora roreri MCA 2997]|uniref:Cytochrome p450 n=1 Tax=Moniliophthora roreri (strain MCA 2997) TaxID=1381753 RepID=V2XS40_MONRO|nr:cytochrome p450 [Moniliophthora roreri MCA 2997]